MTRFELEDPTDEVTRLQIGVTEEVARGRELGSEQIGEDGGGAISEQIGEDGGGADRSAWRGSISLDRSRSARIGAVTGVLFFFFFIFFIFAVGCGRGLGVGVCGFFWFRVGWVLVGLFGVLVLDSQP